MTQRETKVILQTVLAAIIIIYFMVTVESRTDMNISIQVEREQTSEVFNFNVNGSFTEEEDEAIREHVPKIFKKYCDIYPNRPISSSEIKEFLSDILREHIEIEKISVSKN
jgi:hypothetical protein